LNDLIFPSIASPVSFFKTTLAPRLCLGLDKGATEAGFLAFKGKGPGLSLFLKKGKFFEKRRIHF
jgi:hypothetical protein